MRWDFAVRTVVSSAERVADVVERVCDWETARRRVCGILMVGLDGMKCCVN